MASNQASIIYEKVNSLLDGSSIHDAIALLSDALSRQSDPSLRDLLTRQEDTYKYMTHYLMEGFPDNGRSKMISDIISSLSFINDSILRNNVAIDSPDIYSSTLRMERIRKHSLDTLLNSYREALAISALAEEAGNGIEMRKRADDALLALFSHVWTAFGLSPENYKRIADYVTGKELPFEFKAQMISALMLGNFAYYDRNGLTCLLDIFESDCNPRISARALVAIVLVVARHAQRVAKEQTLSHRFALWNDSIIIYRQLREVVMAIIKAHDTERINTKMKNEVIPELMKLRPEILNKLRNFSETTDMELLDANPEWEDILNKNGLGDKLKELTEMQMEGGDVMMMAFSNLKSFPFFNNPANWFLPFSQSHHELASGLMNDSLIFSAILDMEGVMCDSDKYSFALSMKGMPEAQKKMLTERMGDQMAQLKEAMAEKSSKSSIPEFDMEVTRYVRNLYRFFKLFKRKNEFADPFASPLDFKALPFLEELLTDTEIMTLVGEFYFKRGYYKEALPIMLRLEEQNSEDSLMWEKIGYCYNSLKDTSRALTWYRKAELVHPDSKWLITKMALCLRLENRYEEAAQYYSKALAVDPDNYNLLMSAGNCLLESDNIEEALKDYYHADYVRPGKISTWRAIAWAELRRGYMDKSLEYYDRITSMPDSNATDWLNKGHACYLSNDYKNTVECYKKATKFNGYGIEKLEADILQDAPIIEKSGGNLQELHILLDKVKYDTELG